MPTKAPPLEDKLVYIDVYPDVSGGDRTGAISRIDGALVPVIVSNIEYLRRKIGAGAGGSAGVAPPPILVTDATKTQKVLVNSTGNTVTYYHYQLIEFILPATTDTPIEILKVRGIRDNLAGAYNWGDLAGTEIAVAPQGNAAPTDSSRRNLYTVNVVKTVQVDTTDQNNHVSQTDLTTGPTRLIIRAEAPGGAQSTDVIIDVAAASSTTTYPVPDWLSPLILGPSGVGHGQAGELRFRELAANGTNTVGLVAPDAIAADFTLVLPTVAPGLNETLIYDPAVVGYPAGFYPMKWAGVGVVFKKLTGTVNGTNKSFSTPDAFVSGTLMVVADGQVLVDTSFSPGDGADFAVSGQVVTIASGRGAPESWIGAFYQISS